jgi:hypothetical protein
MIKHYLLFFIGLFWTLQAFADYTHEEFFAVLKKGDYALISAGRNLNDPADQKLSEQEITTRTLKLENELKSAKFKYQKVIGKYNVREESFFVTIKKKQEPMLQKLGEKFKQESIIIGSHGLQKMIYTSGKNKNLAYSGIGFNLVDEEQTDYYTELVTVDGKKIRFSLNFDFDRKCKNRLQVYNICSTVEPSIP